MPRVIIGAGYCSYIRKSFYRVKATGGNKDKILVKYANMQHDVGQINNAKSLSRNISGRIMTNCTLNAGYLFRFQFYGSF